VEDGETAAVWKGEEDNEEEKRKRRVGGAM
jgi:hypothetical protein